MRKFILALALAVLPAITPAQSVHSTWAVSHAPAAAAQATITKAAVVGWRHIITSGTICVSAAATAQTPLQVVLRDGASGVGTVVWTARLSAPVSTTSCVTIPDTFTGALGGAVTLETVGATAAGAFATVSLSGFDTI